MLSRIADSLFWVGRYLERAEDLSRILDVQLQRFIEDPTVDEEQAAEALLAAMGFELSELTDETLDARTVLNLLCYDAEQPSSIRAILANIRETARRIRETLSVELWEAINTTYHEVMSSSFTAIRPTAALQLVRLRCVQIAGLANQSMIHDEAYHFMLLGRYLERVDMTSRLISALPGPKAGLVAWTNALRGVGGYHAFTRTYAGEGDIADAARFLIVDRRFPRSLVFGLQAVQDSLAELDPVNVKARTDAISRVVGRVRSGLEYMDPAELAVDLHDRMEQVQMAVLDVSRRLSKRYFEGAELSVWRREEVLCD